MPLPMNVRGLWVTALSHCGTRRQGFVPASWVQMVCGLDDDGEQMAKQLVDAGLWDEADGGWVFHDWDQYQAGGLSEQRAAAGKVGGLTRALRAAEERVAELENAAEQPESKQTQATVKHPSSEGQRAAKHPPKHGPVPEPVPVPEEPTLLTADAVEVEPVPDFDDWWKPYLAIARGRPTGAGNRRPAEQQWNRLKPDERRKAVAALAPLAELMALRDRVRDDPFPMQHGRTHLSRRGFDDVARELEDLQTPAAVANAPPKRDRTADALSAALRGET